MATPLKRDDSSVFHFMKRVPADVLERARGMALIIELPPVGAEPSIAVAQTIKPFIKFSLRCRDPEAAKIRQAHAAAHVGQVFEAIRGGPKPLSQKQAVAIAGDVYRHIVELNEEEPGTVDNWAAVKGYNRAVREGRIDAPPALRPNERYGNEIEIALALFGVDLTNGIDAFPTSPENTAAMEARFGVLASWALLRHKHIVDQPARIKLLREIERAVTKAALTLKRNAAGDYTSDKMVDQFPAFQTSTATTITSLFERWKDQTNPSASTLMTWRGIMADLRKHLGHDDARRVTPEEIVSWRDGLIARKVSPRTIGDGYLAAAHRIFRLALRDKLLSINPAADIKMPAKRRAGHHRLPYEDAEVGRLLALASQETSPARRWLPWLAALSGARIGEVAQLSGARIRVIDGIHVMDLRPAEDGGSLKTAGSERTIPLHPALIEAGFLVFVTSRGPGPLFYSRSSGATDRMHASKGVSNHLGAWIRSQGFDDPRKAPNHALRHWWKSKAARVGMQEGIADAIQGHAGRSEADTYRHYKIADLFVAITLIPVP